jgi:polar amino acid transport system substrate-binding protein
MKHLPRKFTSRVAVVALIASLSLCLSACTQVSDTSSSESAVGGEPASDADTPSSLAESLITPGVLTVSIFDDSPPAAFYTDNERLIGWEVELANNIAQIYGLETEFVGGSFDSVINAVADGKADIGIASMFDTLERQQKVSFVDYFIGGTSWVARANSDLSSIQPCGLRVGAVKNTVQFSDYLVRVSSTCTSKGLEPLTIIGYESLPDAVSDVGTGRLDAFVADDPVAAYLVSNDYGRIERTDSSIEPQPYGIAVQLRNLEMVESVQSALQEMAADQTYRDILGRWGVERGSIGAFTINNSQATSTE